ncbi:serendipity locus protein alpha [Drosophila serrata]|uniref:serendipity locus protein alpha n=1 Tax=Drosophila serrata TaxID=7274 RepID=UPI000A1CFD50|nr:serendipity locus protein alpha [Drosophila serrata]
MDALLSQLNACSELIAEGATSTGNLVWLNEFCATFLDFASDLKALLPELAPCSDNIDVETIFLCLHQVVACIPHLEKGIRADASQMTKLHFLDRLEWCMRRLLISLTQLETSRNAEKSLEDTSFVELMDLALNRLDSYIEKLNQKRNISINIFEESLLEDYPLTSIVNHIVRHALAFANVAILTDKKALSALCETLLGECATFHEEGGDLNPGHRKLEALSLERALFALESYLNEALLHLLFVGLIEFENTSVAKIKEAVRSDSHTARDLIDSFDTNMDRIQQIGVLAIAFSQNIKTKTIVRSCLASLESLDACIVPALQLPESTSSAHHVKILEDHFNEEMLILRSVIHEIVDSSSLINNFLDTLAERIQMLDKDQLNLIVQMGSVLVDHFRLPANYSLLDDNAKEVHKDFTLILRECKAVVNLAFSLDPKRIAKRLKMLYSVLAKLRNLICKDTLEDASILSKEQSHCGRSKTFIKKAVKK